MKVGDLITLPNKNHGIKECVFTIFLKSPIKNLEDFPKFFKSNLLEIFDKYEIVKTFSFTFSNNPNEKNRQEVNDLGGYKLFKLEANTKPQIVCQFVNEKDRQYVALHCFEYVSWKTFRESMNVVFFALSKYINIGVSAFNLYYLDEFKSNKEEISIESIFRKQSDLLPSGFFKSQSSFLVFNTQRHENSDKFDYFDKIELKVQNGIMSIGHSTIISIEEENFKNLIQSEMFWRRIEWAHDNNKLLLKDVLSEEIQEFVGLK